MRLGLALAVWLGAALGAAALSDARADAACPGAARGEIRDVEVVCLAAPPPAAIEVGELPAVGLRGPPTSVQVGERPAADESRPARPEAGDLLALRYETDDIRTYPLAVAQATLQEPPIDAVYEVGPRDRLSIVVWRNPDLSTGVTVRPDGRISVPLIEDLYVTGMTASEIAREVEKRLSEFVQDPVVTIVVNSFSGTYEQQIRIIGSASPPTAIPYREGMRLLDVMVAVGGISSFGNGNRAMILRGAGQDRRQIPLRLDDLLDDGDATANIEVAPGDILVIPEGFFDGDWRFTQGATFNQEFTDNVDRDPDGRENAALITEAGPTWDLNVDTARIDFSLNSSAQIRQQFLHDAGTSLRGSVNAAGNVELFEDFFFIDASAASSRLTLDTTTSGADSDQSQVTSASVSPYIVNRFGSFADQTVTLRASQTLIDSGSASNTSTGSLDYSLDSGRDFGKFGWSVGASTSRSLRSDSDDLSESNASLDVSYQVSRSFAVSASGGYQIRDDGDSSNDVNDPTWDIGFDWRPSRRTNVSLSYGQRDAERSFSADASYDITSRTFVSMSYSEELETAQERLEDNLAAVAIDPDSGALIDSGTDLAFQQNTNPFSVEDESTRTRRINVNFRHSKRRDSYSASVQAEDSRRNGSVDERSFEASASWNRRINPRTDLSVSGSVRRAEFERTGRNDTDLDFDTSLTCDLYTDLTGFVSYSFSRRFSDSVSSEYVENSIQAGFSVTF